jgi:hypothetical protein
MKPISATTTIPAVPNIWFANHPEDNALYKLTTKNYLQVILDIQDDGSTNDYYIITASSIREFNFPDNPNVTHIYYWSNRLNSKSSLIEIVYSSPSYNYVQNNFDWESSAYSPSQKEIIFSDKLFNGQQISIPIDIADGRWWSHTTQIHLHVTVISEEYYQLLRSFAALSKTRDQLFSDGIQIYGNIKNGQGIWAAITHNHTIKHRHNMKNYIFILILLVFMACEKTIIVGGTLTDDQTRDSIEGIEMGLYMAKLDFNYDEKRFSDLELIATATSNNEGFFSMEVAAELDLVSNSFYFPLMPQDTSSVNAQYTAKGAQFLYQVDYGAFHEYRLARSSNVEILLLNSTLRKMKMKYAGGTMQLDALYNSDEISAYIAFDKLFTGQQHVFEFYTMDDEYLGSVTRYIKTKLPEDQDIVEWQMPLQLFEIDFNTLTK